MKASVSIHDVMPHTMQNIKELIDICSQFGITKPTLLIVPNQDWSQNEIDELKKWQKQGFPIAAHGWRHECDKINNLWHKIHSKLISRKVAEHLSLDQNEVSDLMDRSGAWFVENGLEHPEIYVPPAWALGTTSMRTLSHKPYKIVETLSGFLLPHLKHRVSLPLVGFEADTIWRAVALKFFNSLAMNFHFGRAVRISLHPQDHHLLLKSDLERILGKCDMHLSYTDLAAQYEPRAEG